MKGARHVRRQPVQRSHMRKEQTREEGTGQGRRYGAGFPSFVTNASKRDFFRDEGNSCSYGSSGHLRIKCKKIVHPNVLFFSLPKMYIE